MKSSTTFLFMVLLILATVVPQLTAREATFESITSAFEFGNSNPEEAVAVKKVIITGEIRGSNYSDDSE